MRQRGSTRLNTLLILLIVALLASVAVPTWQAHYGFLDKEGFRFSDIEIGALKRAT